MDFFEFISVYGSDGMSVICYGVFDGDDLNAAYVKLKDQNSFVGKSSEYCMIDDDWPNGVLLIDNVVDSKEEVMLAISDGFTRMFNAGPCKFSLLMYDGAFNGYESLFSENIFEQIYAFSFGENKCVINLDASLLSSELWKNVVANCRLRAAS
ncbi:hypothetical protein [Xanthomonas sacchari]|uniref:hypothetical protein n=1 Tax=Xanthomonas sacchari TaxID=56458 RepID=UPI0011104A02|nr:hypothetical protein [Xanthomonas sacchari]MDV0439766.1 hypothetical protein [Xanthomonas sacchari]